MGLQTGVPGQELSAAGGPAPGTAVAWGGAALGGPMGAGNLPWESGFNSAVRPFELKVEEELEIQPVS